MNRILFSVVSWEERCSHSFAAALTMKKCNSAVCFVDSRYSDRSIEVRRDLSLIANSFGISVTFLTFVFDEPVSAFRTIQSYIKSSLEEGMNESCLDISTAPRNIIWTTLAALQPHLGQVDIWYLPAKSYGDWQTREDREPRLILNRSGIMYPDKPTCLLVFCGWELSRAEKMFYKFEPRKILLFRDVDAPNYGKIQYADIYFRSVVQEFIYDNKDLSDKNMEELLGIVRPLVDDYNILCCSFGPKLGAVLSYRLVTTFDSIGLAYVPAGDHNKNMSEGIGGGISYELKFDCFIGPLS